MDRDREAMLLKELASRNFTVCQNEKLGRINAVYKWHRGMLAEVTSAKQARRP